MIVSQYDASLLEHKTYTQGHKYHVNQTELNAIEKLHSVGIFAQPGRVTHYKYADVVAWGCVLLEIRTANYNPASKAFTWHVRARRTKEDVIRGHLIILVAIDADGTSSHHVFPTNHPCLYIDGKMKKGTKYTPGATQTRRSIMFNPLTDEIMQAHSDAWHLIEQARVSIGKTYSIDSVRNALIGDTPKIARPSVMTCPECKTEMERFNAGVRAGYYYECPKCYHMISDYQLLEKKAA